MAAGITLSTAARNAACNAIVNLINTSGPGTLQVGTASFASILATLTLSNPAFGAAAAGSAALSGAPKTTTALANGTAAVWRLRDGTTATIIDGVCRSPSDDGSDINLSLAARNAALDAIDTLINTGAGTASLQITTAADTTFTTPLVTLSLGNPAFGAAAAGSMALSGTPSGNATAAGTAALFRIRDRGDAEVLRGSVGTSGEDINFTNNIFGVGSLITISSYSLAWPATSAASSGVLVFPGGLAFTSGETIELTSASFAV